ncbi:methionine ABC transporter ATP-binding protein [Microbacterium sp. CIAB417]|uniref:methionine ABC transporter ATP-binding protein n=1 Tax=Microbacterium sp. CIAB417 TaxID=2860287 RepID=UPI001FAB952A|nr:ATP-binding cassette domain-containing protein [Microbacterium sp. CIAB417]
MPDGGSAHASDVAVRFEAVTRRFPGSGADQIALDRVDLTIARGDIFGVIGHSGAGKSTLIRMINALEVPTEGVVHVDGVDLASLPAAQLRSARKRTAMIFQQFQLLETITVLENVALPLRLDGVGRREAHARAVEALEFVGLGERTTAYPGQLSGGQKQRVGIARAIVRNPAVLLCDEATSALDPSTTQQTIDLLRRVNHEYGTTIFVVTHEMDVIKDLCHSVAVMSEGRVVEQGSVMDVFLQPRTPIAQAFVSTVIPQELPERVRRAVGGHPLWRLRFLDDEVTTPIVGTLISEFGLQVNILHADMTDIQDRTVGHMIIQVEGSPRQQEEAFAHLAERVVGLEEVVL